MKTYWISFADLTGNLGCCIIEAPTETDAIDKVTELGINPGGEALVFEIPDDCEDATAFEHNKLISKQELLNNGYKMSTDFTEEQQDKMYQMATVVDAKYNG